MAHAARLACEGPRGYPAPILRAYLAAGADLREGAGMVSSVGERLVLVQLCEGAAAVEDWDDLARLVDAFWLAMVGRARQMIGFGDRVQLEHVVDAIMREPVRPELARTAQDLAPSYFSSTEGLLLVPRSGGASAERQDG